MMFAAPAMVQVDTRSVGFIEKQIADRLKAAMPPGDVVFEVYAGGTRGGAQNAMIAAVQAALDRNPFYVNDKSKAAIVEAIRKLFDSSRGVRAMAENTIKQLLLIAIGENFQAQRNPNGGKFRPLTAAYAAAKRRKFGFVTPVLKATGDLLGGLKVRVTRKS